MPLVLRASNFLELEAKYWQRRSLGIRKTWLLVDIPADTVVTYFFFKNASSMQKKTTSAVASV